MLEIEESTPRAYAKIVESLAGRDAQDSRIGDTREALGVVVQSNSPRQRMMYRPNYNLAFALQERFAYWHGLNPGHVERYNSNMERYVQDDGKMRGSAYGRYLRRLPHDQIQRALEMLEEDPETRRAVINVHNAAFEEYDCNDVACTIYLQPMLRNGELHMFANLRSQDMLWGYPYDTQAFQWLQEMLAAQLGARLGSFTYYINSCHYYLDFEEDVLESKRRYEYDTAERPLTANADEHMRILAAKLAAARQGKIPDVTDLPQPFRDWALVMTAYEQYRFHEDAATASRITDRIDRWMWRNWMEEKL